MNWPTPLADMMQMWTATQQNVWSAWLNTMQGIGRTPTPDLRGKLIETWQQSVRQSLDAQAKWMNAWLENLKRVEGMPDAARQWLDRGQQEMEQWHGAQRQLWEHLFDILQKAEPETSVRSLQQTSEQIFQTWQKSAQQMMENQLEWIAEWTQRSTPRP